MIEVKTTYDKLTCNIEGKRGVIREEVILLFNQLFELDKNLLTNAMICSKFGQYVMSNEWENKTE